MIRYKVYTVVQGDTLQSIAHKTLGDVTRWVDIMEYNELMYPYIVQSSEEKLSNIEHLITWGDQIIIPDDTSIASTELSKLNQRDKDYILDVGLGRDLDMTHKTESYQKYGTSDNVLELVGNTLGDLKTVRGVENVKQALHARLLTPKGSLLLHPNYGSNLHNLFGKADIIQMRLIEVDICNTILSDGRVETCTLLHAELIEDRYQGSFLVELKSLDETFNILIQNDLEGQIMVRDGV